jgi:hypothetical protein
MLPHAEANQLRIRGMFFDEFQAPEIVCVTLGGANYLADISACPLLLLENGL